MSHWNTYSASVIGKGHIDAGITCQDAHAIKRVGNDWLIAIVCDGAGSASHSDIGAQHATTKTAELLGHAIEMLNEANTDPLKTLQEQLPAIITTIRQQLLNTATEMQITLRDLACTLVGTVLHNNRGFFLHIGDGFGIAEFIPNPDGTINPEAVSAPENGEYANETWFITADDWLEHLRITPFDGAIGRLALMSDGAMPFVLAKGQRSFSAPFINPICKALVNAEEKEGCAAIHSILANEKTYSITSDDKTLLLVLPKQ